MRSDLVKVLHPLAGLPMVGHVLDLCRRLNVKRTLVVIGHQAERVKDALATYPVEFILQAEQRGTAHAVLMTEGALSVSMAAAGHQRGCAVDDGCAGRDPSEHPSEDPGTGDRDQDETR